MLSPRQPADQRLTGFANPFRGLPWLVGSARRAPPDLVVLGTSNCIGPGSFAARIEETKSASVHNLSIGASSSTVGLYMLDLVRPSRCGIALLDYAINDNDAAYNLWGEARAASTIASNLRTLGNRLRSLGYFPIVAILPSDLSFERFLGERLHEDHCRRESLNFINLRKMFISAIKAGADRAFLMRDDWHMSQTASELFAGCVAAMLRRLKALRAPRSRQVASALSSRVIPAERLFRPGALVKRSSSLRSDHYGRLAVGEAITLALDGNERVAGLMINVGARGGTVAIHGSKASVVKSLTFQWSDKQPPAYFSMLVDVGQAVTGGGEGVTVEVVPDETPVTEATIHGRPAPPGRDGEVEIEGVLVTSVGEVELDFAAPDYRGLLPLDLGELPEGRELFDALLRLRA